MARLSKTQRLLLEAAANRGDHSLLPGPETVRARGRMLDRTLIALVKRGSAEEHKTADAASAWRQDEDGHRVGVFATATGLAAIGIAEDDQSAQEAAASLTRPLEQAPARPRGKLGSVLDAIERASGATIEDLSIATGWLPHTTRAAITRLRQRGFGIRLETENGRRAYRISEAA